MIIQTTRFGELTVAEEAVLKFSHGLPGFPEEKDFVLLPYQVDSPFAFLQSVKDPDLSFMIVEPFTFLKDYDFELDDTIATELGVSAENPPQIFNIVRIPDKLEDTTVNLVAPIIINSRDGKGRQIILESKTYTIRHKLFPAGLPKPKHEGGK